MALDPWRRLSCRSRAAGCPFLAALRMPPVDGVTLAHVRDLLEAKGRV